MSKLDGIKDFIKANKSSLKNMNQEMKVSYGRAPLVWLTIEEAKKLMKLLDLCEYWLTNNNVSYDCNAWASLLEERIAQAKDNYETE